MSNVTIREAKNIETKTVIKLVAILKKPCLLNPAEVVADSALELKRRLNNTWLSEGYELVRIEERITQELFNFSF